MHWVLRLSPTIQKHACVANWEPYIARRFVCVNVNSCFGPMSAGIGSSRPLRSWLQEGAATEDGCMDIFVLVSELVCVPGSAKPAPEHFCTSSAPPVHPQRHDRVGAKQADGLLHMYLPPVQDGPVSPSFCHRRFFRAPLG